MTDAVAAFQFRVKDMDQHEAAALAEPLQAICAEHEVAFVVNDSVPLASASQGRWCPFGAERWRRESGSRSCHWGLTPRLE